MGTVEVAMMTDHGMEINSYNVVLTLWANKTSDSILIRAKALPKTEI